MCPHLSFEGVPHPPEIKSFFFILSGEGHLCDASYRKAFVFSLYAFPVLLFSLHPPAEVKTVLPREKKELNLFFNLYYFTYFKFSLYLQSQSSNSLFSAHS